MSSNGEKQRREYNFSEFLLNLSVDAEIPLSARVNLSKNPGNVSDPSIENEFPGIFA